MTKPRKKTKPLPIEPVDICKAAHAAVRVVDAEITDLSNALAAELTQHGMRYLTGNDSESQKVNAVTSLAMVQASKAAHEIVVDRIKYQLMLAAKRADPK